MSVETHKNPICTHCCLSEALNDFRNSPHAARLVAKQREDNPEGAYRYSDDQLVRFAFMRAIGIIAIDLVEEEDDVRIKIEMMMAFQEAAATQQVHYGLLGGRS